MQDVDSIEKSRMSALRREQESGVSTKLDWMYGNPTQTIDNEEYLLGRAIENKNHVEHECIPPSLRDLRGTSDAITDQVDIAKKLQEDPLFEIHRREIEARKQMLQNPIKMKEMQQLLQQKSKKVSEEDLDKKLLEKYMKLKHIGSYLNRKVKKSKHKKKSKNKGKDSDDDKPKSKKSDKVSKHRDRSSSRERSAKKHKRRNSSDSSEESEDDKRKRRKDKSTREFRDEHKDKRNKRDHEDRSKHSRKESRERHDDHHSKNRQRSASPEHSGHKTKTYGLVNAAGEKLHLPRAYKSKPSTKSDTHESQKSAWERPQKKRLTEEEKEKKRREMLDNVMWKEKTKTAVQAKESDEPIDDYKKDPEFLKKYLQNSTNISSIESRIRSNINNIQRRTTDMDKNFAKR